MNMQRGTPRFMRRSLVRSASLIPTSTKPDRVADVLVLPFCFEIIAKNKFGRNNIHYSDENKKTAK